MNQTILYSQVKEKNDDYYQENHKRLSEGVFDNRIKTVLLHKKGIPLSFPLISLNSNDQLHLSFDDFGSEMSDYYYELVHCDANWDLSDVSKPEYLNGIPEDIISEYDYSSGLYQKYAHYWLDFPKSNMKPMLSGNYIISVFRNGDRDSLILNKKFMVVNRLVLIEGRVDKSGDPEFRKFKQQLNFSIYSNEYDLSNPYTDMNVVIVQNGNWEKSRSKVQPIFVKGNELEFNMSDDALFWGGSNYRNINLRSIRYRAENINDIRIHGDSIEVNMMPDLNLGSKVYANRGDLNGGFVITQDVSLNPHLDAEYCWANFFLKSRKISGKIYIVGKFNNWQKTKESEMRYDSLNQLYMNTYYLKQGYYDYKYHIELSKLPEWYLEGSHWQTDNNYSILVYHKKLGDRTDRLIGFLNLNSLKNNTIILERK